MKEWERMLALWNQRGWNYAYVKCVDLEDGGADAYYVCMQRDGLSLSSVKPSIEEAVFDLNKKMVSEAA